MVLLHVLQNPTAQNSVERVVGKRQLRRIGGAHDVDGTAQRYVGERLRGVADIERRYLKAAPPKQVRHLPEPTSPIEQSTRWNLCGNVVRDADVVPDDDRLVEM